MRGYFKRKGRVKNHFMHVDKIRSNLKRLVGLRECRQFGKKMIRMSESI